MSKPVSITRRHALKTITIACCCSGTALANQGPKIDQITDPGASTATEMFRFEPNYIEVTPGEQVVFLNSRGEHTVHSVPQLWPEGAPPVAISNQPEVAVNFDAEGLYAFRCRRHGLYGMVMLVVCGNGGDPELAVAQVGKMKAKKREKQAFLDLISEYERRV